MSLMLAFGWSSIMLLLGMLLRAKVGLLRNMLVPASVIAGILGIIFVNIAETAGVDIGTDTSMFTTIVNHLFTVSFISISLMVTPRNSGNTPKVMLKGIIGMGVVWSLLYAITPIIGACVVYLTGKSFDMNCIYGMLIPFAFCQGPGQSVTYGGMFEKFGWPNAITVAVAYSVIGFIVAFVIGIPLAKWGIQKGYAKFSGKIDEKILKGYLKKDEQTATMVKDTTCNSNIETLAFHFALIGLCYVLAVLISKIFSYIPGFLGIVLSSMMFMNGIYAAYIVKKIMQKLSIDFLMENTLQSKITGWTSDYLVVCAFMSVSVSIISKWIVPMFAVCAVMTVVTFFVCMYFGRRFGGINDFERTVGLYGTCTGTVPSGITLIRIVDPDFRTSTSVELGACNIVMSVNTPVYLLILAHASGSLSVEKTIGGMALCAIAYLVLLKVTGAWGKRTY